MNRDKKCHLLAKSSSDKGVYQTITSNEAGWNHLNFSARTMNSGEKWVGETGNDEYLFVLLGGNFLAETSVGTWKTSTGRDDVFSGLPHALYLPQNTKFEITPVGNLLDMACGWCAAEQFFPAQFITPADVLNMGIEYRGGDNASRQINRILPPGSPCSKLVCVEVYTPSGNWSSFPAHKHDTRKIDSETGKLLEAELEEIYFFTRSTNPRVLPCKRSIRMIEVSMKLRRRITMTWYWSPKATIPSLQVMDTMFIT